MPDTTAPVQSAVEKRAIAFDFARNPLKSKTRKHLVVRGRAIFEAQESPVHACTTICSLSTAHCLRPYASSGAPYASAVLHVA
eukprot:1052221-Rhodomonas_salina.1